MNTVFAQIDRSRFLSFAVIFLAACGLLIAILPAMALQAPKAYEVSEAQTGNCYAQLASDPTATFTSTNASAVQTAINAASSNDIVKIAGVCRGISFTNGLSQTAYIDKDITLQGGFTVTNWIMPDLSSLSVLDANKSGRVIYIDGSSAVTLTNLQISHGDATSLSNAGGGIQNVGGSVRLKNVTIINNIGSYGAGLCNSGGEIHIEDSVISENYGVDNDSNYGGGIYNSSAGDIFISNTLIQGHIFTNSVGNAAGAGIFNYGDLIITDSTIKNNLAGSADDGNANGGAINNNGNAHLIINKSNILNNEAASGGGVLNFAVMTITASTFSQNRAMIGGAIANGLSSYMVIEQSTINNNIAGDGGGIDNFGYLTITNSTISQNNGNNGSGIYNGKQFYSYNNSIIHNSPLDFGIGALYSSGNAMTFLSNTLIGNNSPFDCVDSDDVIVSEGHNLDSDGTCIQAGQNFDITSSDIRIGELSDNGGNTFTHALLLGSPAIDAGNCSDDNITLDQRGVSRPQEVACDIGAFEVVAISGLTLTNDSPTNIFQPTSFTSTIGSGDSPVYIWDFGDGEIGSGPNQTHTYSDIGIYTAVMTVSNPINTITATTQVTITGHKIFLPTLISSSE